MTTGLFLAIADVLPNVSASDDNSGDDGPFEPCADGLIIAPRNPADANAADARRIEHKGVRDSSRARHGQPNAGHRQVVNHAPDRRVFVDRDQSAFIDAVTRCSSALFHRGLSEQSRDAPSSAASLHGCRRNSFKLIGTAA
ncbi:hypothetical protein [Methylobacterium planeticum]|uniref:hypothetical protein n=1 Tax=Methylobacterium planeticum TaxID=2615211 RepID=UPI00177AAC94|nr:hypothetical protein [Methylobacterium planeticum]